MTLVTDATASLLREAAEWHLLSVLFTRPTPAWHERLSGLAADDGDADLLAIASAARGATEGVYLFAFGPNGVVSPREIAHRKTTDPGLVLSQLTGMYDAFAYRPATEEPPDHVSVETGFVAYLRLKEAFAVASNDEDAARITAEGAAQFIEQHLSTFVQPIAERLAADPGFYLARAAQALLRRTGPRRADAEGGWTPDGLDEPFSCGGCEAACD